MNIGLVGEDPLDTDSIKNLLTKKYTYKFSTLIKNQTGCHLDSIPKTKRMLTAELAYKDVDLVIFIRDLDDINISSKKKKDLDKWYRVLSECCKSKTIFLLNVYEIEALIISDIDTFNNIFKTNIKYSKNPCSQQDPKGYLKRITKKNNRPYHESDNPEIFKNLSFEIVKSRCSYFNTFIDNFDRILSLG